MVNEVWWRERLSDGNEGLIGRGDSHEHSSRESSF
jgi:hypothetical protein